jgi:hypothetical protein
MKRISLIILFTVLICLALTSALQIERRSKSKKLRLKKHHKKVKKVDRSKERRA